MKFGFALSGGGARGIAHLGIIKVLEENNIYPGMVAGTSAGSIIGAFYTHGYKPDEILKIIGDTKLYKILRPAFNMGGLISLEKSYSFFIKYFPEDSFESLSIPLTTTAVNIRTGKVRYFYSGNLIQSVLASSAIPVIFKPVEIKGEKYIDGGMLNNLPVEPLKGKCDKIIGLHCNPVDENFSQYTMRRIVERSLLLSIGMNVALSKAECHYFFEPPELKKFAAFDFARAKEIFKIGYDYAQKEIGGLLNYLSI